MFSPFLCCIYIFLIFFIASNSAQQENIVTTTIQYIGGTPYCNATSCVNDTYFPYVLCTSSQPSLLQYFEDPVPVGNIVTSINVTLSGMFGCSGVPTVAVTVAKGVIGPSDNIPESTSDCMCDNCGVNVTLLASITDGWPGYQYGGSNSVNIAIEGDENICISQAVLEIGYRPSNPQFNTAVPDASPVTVENHVKITGSDFIPSNNLSCKFGDIETPADYIDYNHLNCTSPNVTSASVVSFEITNFPNNVSIAAGNFTFYVEPAITSFSPTSSSAKGGTDVYLFGSNFFDSDSIVCRFGINAPVTAQYINSSCVKCVNPSNLQTGSTKNVSVFFSENRVQYSKAPGEFTFIGTLPSPSSSITSSATPSISISSSSSLSTSISPSTVTYPSSMSASPSPTSKRLASLPGYIWAAMGVIMIMIIIFLVGCLLATFSGLRKKNQPYSPISDSPSYSTYGSEAGSHDSYTELDPNSIDIKEIKNLKQIEKGSFGVIYEATWRGTIIAVKKLPSNMNQKLLKEFYQEAALMRSLRHPNILQYLGIANAGGEISICMEFMARGSLYRLLHTNSDFTRSKIKSICLDTAKGMNYLHQHNPPIIHRDLKSHNLLVDEHWRVKVCDFGLSRIIVQANATMTACGTPSWTAPEVLRNERYTTKADVYGFGVVVWEMFSRADPFPGMPPFQIVFAVGNQSLRPKINPSWPSKWVKLITDCWAEDPHTRPTFEQIIVRIEALPPPPDGDDD